MAISGAVPGAQPPAGAIGAFASDDNIAGMRIAVPVIKSVQSLRAAKDAMQFSNYSRMAYDGMAGGYGGVRGGFGQFGGVGGMVGSGLRSLPSLLKSNFIISGAMALFTNAWSFFTGKSSGTKFLAGTVADTVAYTGIGASATMIGGMVGSIVPGIGTLIGMGVGALVGFFGGKMYEDHIRPKFVSTLEAKFTEMSGPAVGTSAAPGLPTAPGIPLSPTWPR